MATLNIKVIDQATGYPMPDVAVVITVAGVGTFVTSGFTNKQGGYSAAVRASLLVGGNYQVTASASGFVNAAATKFVTSNTSTVYLTLAMVLTPVDLPEPINYPAVVGVGQAPDMVINLPAGVQFDEVVTQVAGAYPSKSRSPIPATGAVIVPLAQRLVVAPPSTLQLIDHAERIRRADELKQQYTVTVSARTKGRLIPIGTFVVTAVLADVANLEAQLLTNPWLLPWPGVVPVERGGYTEVVAALRQPPATPVTYTVLLSSHASMQGPITAQEIATLAAPAGASACTLCRIRIPDFTTPYIRLLINSSVVSSPPLWFAYRTL